MNWKYLIAALFLIVFEMVPEGLALSDHKTIAGVFEFVYLTGVTLAVFALFNGQLHSYFPRGCNFVRILIGYILVRFALADPIFNLCAGLDWYFVGSTKLYDKIWLWFFTSGIPPNHFFFMFKFLIALPIGTSLLLRKNR